jgi:transposase-like protein
VNPELTGSRKRRTFTAKDKLRILAETDAAAGSGDIGSILRREGVYSSVLHRWRRQRDSGTLNALSPAKRGPKPVDISPDAEDNRRLRTENARLKERLARAETIIDFQKKVSELLAIPLSLPNSDRDA